MKRNLYLMLGLLLAFACCDPIDTPTPPSGGENDSTIVDRDTVNWGDSIVIPDSVDAVAIDVVIDPADDTSYTEEAEEIIKNKEHDDYGDFVENCPASAHVKVVYADGVATVTGASGSISTGKAGSVSSGVMAKVTGMHVEVSSTKKDVAFTLEGTSENGSFKIMDAGDSNKRTHIVLNGLSLVNPKGAAINIQSSKTMLVELVDGTANYLEDGEEYVLNGDEQQKGVFFSEGQLVFNGGGSLTINGHYKHGIASDDYVRIRNGHFAITSVSDGISTKERFIMYGGVVDINAGQDGIDVDEGHVEIGGGVLRVQAVDEALTASYEGMESVDPYINIKGGFIKLTTTGDKGHALRAMSTFAMSGGIVQIVVKGAGSKALMSEGDMSFSGGKVTAFAEGDALYEDGDLSSSAAIRSKGTLTVRNMVIGAKSTGTGGKGINNVGDVTMINSLVTIVAIGENHHYGNLDSHSRGVVTDGNLTLDGGALLVKSYDDPLHVGGEQCFLNDAMYEGYQIGGR